MRALPILTVLISALFLVNKAAGQTAAGEYYATIGVFAVQDNAVRLTAKANKMGFSAQYAINLEKNWYYVYLLQSDDKRKVTAFVIKLRAESQFKDAWAFTGHLGNEPVVVKEPVVPVVPVVEKKDSVVVAEKPPVDSSTLVKKTEPPPKRVVKGKLFMFKFINAETGNEVRGEVHFAESNRANQYQAFKADEVIDLPAPRNSQGMWFLSTIAPGYKGTETHFNYRDPADVSTGTGPEGELIIPLNLERAKRGDYIEFNSVTFYRNSAVLQPESESELQGLADLMKENEKYRVKVHAHCNGTEARDIITLGTSKKYFENDPGNVKKAGSAKELTELMAETVRRYLVSQGIDVERILTKGEGGKAMVYPQNSVYANYNNRV